MSRTLSAHGRARGALARDTRRRLSRGCVAQEQLYHGDPSPAIADRGRLPPSDGLLVCLSAASRSRRGSVTPDGPSVVRMNGHPPEGTHMGLRACEGSHRRCPHGRRPRGGATRSPSFSASMCRPEGRGTRSTGSLRVEVLTLEGPAIPAPEPCSGVGGPSEFAPQRASPPFRSGPRGIQPDCGIGVTHASAGRPDGSGHRDTSRLR